MYRYMSEIIRSSDRDMETRESEIGNNNVDEDILRTGARLK